MQKSVQTDLLRPEATAELTGTLDRVVFHNESNGYCVLRVKSEKPSATYSAVGVMPNPQAGVSLRLEGEWVEHPKFGRQFQFSAYQVLMPATEEGIRHYLGSGLIPGIGPGRAKRIVDHFKGDTLRILDEEPQRLAEVKGLPEKAVDAIARAWTDHVSIRSLIMFLQPHNISSSYAVKIFRHFGAESLEVVRSNPYILAMKIRGIGFLTADAIAMKLGVPKDSPMRAAAGVIYVLTKLNDDGHVYYPLDKLVDKSAADLDIDPDLAEQAVKKLEEKKEVVLEDLELGGKFLHTAVYLSYNYHFESGIARYLRRIILSPKSAHFKNKDEALAAGLAHSPVTLAEGQEEAVSCALESKVMVITGGPGTGKTTVINAIIKVFEQSKCKVLLAAPTGRAAKRMTETSGREAKTIHRLLEYSPMEDGFARNESNPLACGLLVVDEASMLDTMLMYHLLKALPLGATVIFVGDVNQLPSVGAGNVLKDVISSGTVAVAELTEIFRQARESAIIINAHRINEGEMPMGNRDDDKLSDFYFIRNEDPEKCADMVVDLVANHIPRRFKLHPVNDIQVLTPMHKGAVGATALNIRLQNALNSNTEFVSKGDRQFRLDDKVMQIRNNYEKEVFNGDIGRICYLDRENRELTVRFEDRNVIYAQEELDELVPAYAISVHKSQGSEYPAVVLPLLTQHYVLLQRNLLYTAVTRGKKLVIVVGSPKAVAMAVHNDKTVKRYTWLQERLRQGEAYGL